VASATSVIEMNVGQKDCLGLLATESFEQSVGAGCWARVDDHLANLPAAQHVLAA
jgi:hypothetical protein